MPIGVLPPDSGTVKRGTNLAAAILDQRRETLDPEPTLASSLITGECDTVSVAGPTRHVVGYMKDCLFRPEPACTPVGTLSGDEPARLILTGALARSSNLLVLDELTNARPAAGQAGRVSRHGAVGRPRPRFPRPRRDHRHHERRLGRWDECAGGYSDMLA
jgi:ATP-binding cassette subfamily F protein uup